jgi:hypothetical protein
VQAPVPAGVALAAASEAIVGAAVEGTAAVGVVTKPEGLALI